MITLCRVCFMLEVFGGVLGLFGPAPGVACLVVSVAVVGLVACQVWELVAGPVWVEADKKGPPPLRRD